VQIHNATLAVLGSGPLMDSLERARDDGKVRLAGCIGVWGGNGVGRDSHWPRSKLLQLAASILDQRMCGQVLPEAERLGVGVLTRSAC